MFFRKITPLIPCLHKIPSPAPSGQEGNVTFTKSVRSVKNSTVYRADTRPPAIIKQFGFSGTNSNEPCEVRVFGKDTVFASGSKDKAKNFVNLIDHQGKKQTYYLYQIKTNRQEVFSFKENMYKNPASLVDGVADLAIRELKISKNEARALARSAIDTDYLAVDEVQIKGPISPSNIEHIDTINING